MSLFVDTSVWSSALRRDVPDTTPQTRALVQALGGGQIVVTTGLVLQELLQGFSGPTARAEIVERFAALPLLAPDRQDHIAAADLRNEGRRVGIQIGTIDALLAQLCIRHDLTLLTNDQDFAHIAEHTPLRIWQG